MKDNPKVDVLAGWKVWSLHHILCHIWEESISNQGIFTVRSWNWGSSWIVRGTTLLTGMTIHGEQSLATSIGWRVSGTIFEMLKSVGHFPLIVTYSKTWWLFIPYPNHILDTPVKVYVTLASHSSCSLSRLRGIRANKIQSRLLCKMSNNSVLCNSLKHE